MKIHSQIDPKMPKNIVDMNILIYSNNNQLGLAVTNEANTIS